MRRSPKIDEVVPLLYLRGLSTGDMYPVLEKLLGESVSGLSAANISRLKACWHREYEQWRKQDLSGREYCYIWVDGIHFNVRFSDNRPPACDRRWGVGVLGGVAGYFSRLPLAAVLGP
jgi:putative transposase